MIICEILKLFSNKNKKISLNFNSFIFEENTKSETKAL